VRLNESRVFYHVGELARSTLSDWTLPRNSSSSSRILRKAKTTATAVEFGLDERETAIERIILVGLRTGRPEEN